MENGKGAIAKIAIKMEFGSTEFLIRIRLDKKLLQIGYQLDFIKNFSKTMQSKTKGIHKSKYSLDFFKKLEMFHP